MIFFKIRHHYYYMFTLYMESKWLYGDHTPGCSLSHQLALDSYGAFTQNTKQIFAAHYLRLLLRVWPLDHFFSVRTSVTSVKDLNANWLSWPCVPWIFCSSSNIFNRTSEENDTNFTSPPVFALAYYAISSCNKMCFTFGVNAPIHKLLC